LSQGIPHQALYRRWRAQTFSEMVGQEAVVATLRNAVATGHVAHALLFTGPRGTGKTSLARIVAKAINCENLGPNADPCDTCPSCVAIREGSTLDVIEIDAASNRGIENIRELRERLNYPPGELRKKVYILDEAHQITPPAWNALLKSLEEPPDFVTFMFASTHPQEFPPAILSRLQRFDVRRLTVPEITGKLERILQADDRAADPEAVALVARLAAGGMRDAESILDQLLSSTTGPIEADAVRDLLGLADAELVDGFVASLATGDAVAGIALLDRLEERGRDLRVFLDQVVDALREQLVAGLGTGARADPVLAAAARRLASIDPARLGPGGLRLQLELALLEPHAVTGAPLAVPPAPVPERRAGPNRPAVAPVARPAPLRDRDPERASDPPTAAAEALSERGTVPQGALGVPSEGAAAGDDLERLRAGWGSIVATISKSPPLKPLISVCRPIGVEGNVVTLGFPEEQAFLKDVAERRRANLEEGIGGFLGHDVGVRCVATNLDLLPPLPADEAAAHILAEAHRIFAEDLAEIPEIPEVN
jgi:DNA polymerase-3 subunit gamma/tau